MTISVPRGVPLVLRWDLDKTYLRTEFDRVRDLIRVARESADEKRSVPGATTLLRGIIADSPCRLTFVSGSPTQMRAVLEEKLRLDGLSLDQLILKPNLENALKGRFRALRGQVSYKLPALLSQRAMVPRESPEVCFGDDAEADAFVYRLYGEVVAGRVDEDHLRILLAKSGGYADQIEAAVGFARDVRTRAHGRDPVRRVFIHLDRHSEPGRFHAYGPRVVAITNYAQAALVLHLDGLLSLQHFLDVCVRLIDVHAVAPRRIANGFQDLVRRAAVEIGAVQSFLDRWEESAPAVAADLRDRTRRSLGGLAQQRPMPRESHPDFEELIAAGHLHRSHAK